MSERHDDDRPVRPVPPGRGDDEPQQQDTHTGNRTVNHGPHDQRSEKHPAPGSDGLTSAELASDELIADDLLSDELALRRMLQQAVREIEPSDGTLEHLRRAVPARRARKRQAAVGLAAAALFVGTAIPAVLHVSNSSGGDANPSIAGHGSEAQGGASEGKDKGGSEGTGGSSGQTENQGGGGSDQGAKNSGGSGGDGPSGSTGPSASTEADTPACTSAQLNSTSSVDPPDSVGAVYGTFRITNISGNGCTVDAPGTVDTLAQGAADATRISVVSHTAGDAAGNLPDPSLEVSSLLLKSGDAYEVKFAWVPSETCPSNGGSSSGGTGGDTGGETGGTDPSADPSPTQSTGTQGSSTGGDTGTATQLLGAEGTADGSVTVSYTSVAGAPAVSATVSNACAGTVFRTGVLPTV
ncbi:hypothetical protein [Streptomyces flavalbus]|uniref:DUF4232 domain-containing protein n=1 Tax=Streptomyces flavalbus TaxID=2665155 RepID=A0ABW2WAF8_9ACTN